jgi:hypothetical protein
VKTVAQELSAPAWEQPFSALASQWQSLAWQQINLPVEQGAANVQNN